MCANTFSIAGRGPTTLEWAQSYRSWHVGRNGHHDHHQGHQRLRLATIPQM
jgi:hypothetical protein